jgi:hypothetical protein
MNEANEKITIELREVIYPYIQRLTNIEAQLTAYTTIKCAGIVIGAEKPFKFVTVTDSMSQHDPILEEVNNYSIEELRIKNTYVNSEFIKIIDELIYELTSYDLFKGIPFKVTIDFTKEMSISFDDPYGKCLEASTIEGYDNTGAIIVIPNRKFPIILETSNTIEGRINLINPDPIESKYIIPPQLNIESITEYIEDCLNIIKGRKEQHSPNEPIENDFADIATIFNLIRKTSLNGSDIALLLHILKLVRQGDNETLHEDNLIDGTNYNIFYSLLKKIENNA